MRRTLTGAARAQRGTSEQRARLGRAATAAVLATTLAAVTACTLGSDPGDRSSIDARAYYDDYETADSDQGLMAVPEQDGAADSGSGARRSAPDTSDVVRCDDCRPPRRLPPPPIDERNVFDNAGTSPAVDPSEQARSTFGLDVDTGSYRVAERFLDDGTLPPAASVRPEEWINAFDYSDTAPTTSDLGVTAESGASPETASQLFRVAVDARELRASDRPPASLTFVVDTSGSMDIRERLGLVQSSLALLTKNLMPDDRIGIVTYDEQARTVLEPTPVSESDRILDAVDDLEPGGGTNLEAGLERGYELAADSGGRYGINAVILASDGVANIGLTDPDGLAEQVNEAAADDHIHLVTVGYGMGNYNDDLMEQLADNGQGFYSYVSTFEEAERLFSDDLTSTLSVAAKDAKAQVRFDPETVQSYRLIGYENRGLRAKDFDDETVDAGEIGYGMDVSALYEVTPTDSARSGVPIGTATVRWESATGGTQEEASTTLRMPGVSAEPSDDLRLASTVAGFADAVKHRQGDKGLDERLLALQDSADELAAADVTGAGELSELISEAIDAHPAGGAYEIQ